MIFIDFEIVIIIYIWNAFKMLKWCPAQPLHKPSSHQAPPPMSLIGGINPIEPSTNQESDKIALDPYSVIFH